MTLAPQRPFEVLDRPKTSVDINKSSDVLCGLWVLSAETNYGELKLVSILVRDAVLLGQE